MANSLSGDQEQWQAILQTLSDSANDIDNNFVRNLRQGVQELTTGNTAQVCLVRVGNKLEVQWEPTSVLS